MQQSSFLSSAQHKQRLAIGLGIGAVAFSCLTLGGLAWTLLVLLFLPFGFKELQNLMKSKAARLPFYLTSVSLVLSAYVHRENLFLSIMTAGVVLSFFWQLFRKHPQGSSVMGSVGATLMAIVYIAYLPVHSILLREMGSPLSNPFMEEGFQYLFMMLAVVAFSDIGAYYFGKWFGRNPLIPELSPKKTQEGALGGLFVGVTVGSLFALWTPLPLTHAFILSTTLVASGMLGDLVESQMKREAGVKDSGDLLKSHGGILDRVDSYIFSCAVAYYYIHWFVKHDGLASLFFGGPAS